MTDRDQNIIALAEFTGEIVKVRPSLPYPNGIGWKGPDGQIRPVPNPYESADACEAVMRKLNKLGNDVVVHHNNQDRAWVWLHTSGARLTWKGDDWKEGVCELALKVKEADNE